VLDVVHRRWFEQVEQGLGGRRQSIMNENPNENHAVQNNTGKKKKRNGEPSLMRSACFPRT